MDLGFPQKNLNSGSFDFLTWQFPIFTFLAKGGSKNHLNQVASLKIQPFFLLPRLVVKGSCWKNFPSQEASTHI